MAWACPGAAPAARRVLLPPRGITKRLRATRPAVAVSLCRLFMQRLLRPQPYLSLLVSLYASTFLGWYPHKTLLGLHEKF